MKPSIFTDGGHVPGVHLLVAHVLLVLVDDELAGGVLDRLGHPLASPGRHAAVSIVSTLEHSKQRGVNKRNREEKKNMLYCTILLALLACRLPMMETAVLSVERRSRLLDRTVINLGLKWPMQPRSMRA